MRRSKLEIYIDILRELAHKELKLTHLMYKTNTNCNSLKEYLIDLISKGLVEKKVVGKKRSLYTITLEGLIILKNFTNFKNLISPKITVIEEGGSKTKINKEVVKWKEKTLAKSL